MSDDSYSPAAADLVLSMEAPSFLPEEAMLISLFGMSLAGVAARMHVAGTIENATDLAAGAANLHTEFGGDIEAALVDYVERCVDEQTAVTLAATIAANDAALVEAPADESLLWLETVLAELA